jgi:hypothetical protein
MFLRKAGILRRVYTASKPGSRHHHCVVFFSPLLIRLRSKYSFVKFELQLWFSIWYFRLHERQRSVSASYEISYSYLNCTPDFLCRWLTDW